MFSCETDEMNRMIPDVWVATLNCKIWISVARG